MPDDVRVLGSFPVRIADSAVIEPFVVLDATQGAIVIEEQDRKSTRLNSSHG